MLDTPLAGNKLAQGVPGGTQRDRAIPTTIALYASPAFARPATAGRRDFMRDADHSASAFQQLTHPPANRHRSPASSNRIYRRSRHTSPNPKIDSAPPTKNRNNPSTPSSIPPILIKRCCTSDSRVSPALWFAMCYHTWRGSKRIPDGSEMAGSVLGGAKQRKGSADIYRQKLLVCERLPCHILNVG